MKSILLVVTMIAALDSLAMDANSMMRDFIWEKRVLLLFTPDDGHASFHQQNQILSEVKDGMAERDMTTIRAMADGTLTVDNTKQSIAATDFYQRYSVRENEFRVILVGKDSTVKLDKKSIVTAAELFELIDAMPMRQYEMLQDE
jgi:hypothetical protein